MEHDFKIFFNKKRNYVEVWLEDSHPTTFAKNGGGRWGYFQAVSRTSKVGKLGEVHIIKSRLRYDVIVHELFHATMEWVWSRGEAVDRKNEEKVAEILDELCRKFIQELRKIDPKVNL